MIFPAAAAVSVGVGSPAPPEPISVFEPTFTHVEQGQLIDGVFFDPSANHLYVQIHVWATDVWPFIVRHWPLWGGVIVAVALFAALLALRRVLRHPQRPGERYCRCCNYHLAGLGPTAGPRRCPECGSDLSRQRPIVGRRAAARLAWTAVPTLLLGTAYTAMLVAGVTRFGGPSFWYFPGAERLHRWAKGHTVPWLRDEGGVYNRIAEFDLATGEPGRTLMTRRVGKQLLSAVAPDGRSLFYLDLMDTTVVQRDARSGRVLRSVQVGEGIRAWPVGVIGFGNRDRDAYIVCPDADRRHQRVWRWDLEDGALDMVLDKPGDESWRRRVVFVPGPEPTLIVAALLEGSEVYELSIHRPGEAPLLAHTFPARASDYPSGPIPAASPDGRLLYFVGASGGIETLDLSTRFHRATIEPPGMTPLRGELAITPDGQRLFVATETEPETILVLDLAAKRWSARLAMPSPFTNPRLTLSPDGRWLAAVGYERGAQVWLTADSFGLMLYDLEQLPSPLTPVEDTAP